MPLRYYEMALKVVQVHLIIEVVPLNIFKKNQIYYFLMNKSY